MVQSGAGQSLVQVEDVSMAARAKVCRAETTQGLGIWESGSAQPELRPFSERGRKEVGSPVCKVHERQRSASM